MATIGTVKKTNTNEFTREIVTPTSDRANSARVRKAAAAAPYR
ncbi:MULTISPECIES: hypothetical protein [unclassified Mesorhizobium]|nr:MULTISPECIES: hypothetical protein [unclassified Mesorhizobium]